MRWLASLPFVFLMIALAIVLWPLTAFAHFVLRTILQIRGDKPAGPNDAAALALSHRFLAFLDGRCWKCGVHVSND